MNEPQNQPIKTKSLDDLRSEIDKLEEQLSDAKRKEIILSEQRSPTKSLYKWRAPERIFRPKSRNWYFIAGTIAVISIVIAILTNTFLLVVAIIAVLAIFYALDTIPPKIFDYEILNRGLRIGSKLYVWKEIPKFWITQRGVDVFLNIQILGSSPTVLNILIGDGDIGIIAKELVQFIDYLDPSEIKRDLFQNFVEGRPKNLGDIVNTATPENPETQS